MPRIFYKIYNEFYKSNRCIASISQRRFKCWTTENVIKSPFEDVNIPDLLIHEYLWSNIGKWSNKSAVVCGITNRSYTYDHIYKYSNNFAANLVKRFDVGPNDTIAIMSLNSPEYAIAVPGILAAGATVSTINPLYTAHEIERHFSMSEPKTVIVSSEFVPNLKKALELYKKDVPIISIDNGDNITPDGTTSFKELMEDTSIDLNVLKDIKKDPNDVAFLLFSSGTTGMPKGVQLTHRNIVANCQQQNTDIRVFSDTTKTNQDSTLAVLPFFHGLSILLIHKLSNGLKLVTLPKFEPNSFLNSLKKYQINILPTVPPLVLFLGSDDRVTSAHMKDLRKIVSAAAPLPIIDIEKVLKKTTGQIDFLHAYGLTEASPLVSCSPPGFKNYNSVGMIIPNVKMRVVDGNFKNLDPSQVGEILIKGPNIMKGYKNNFEENSKTILEGNWLRTGDMGCVEKNGTVTVTDRLKELIKVKGFQVPPAELEAVIKEHPSVLDAAVIGVPDTATGEAPRAFVVTKRGVKVESSVIIDFVGQRVSPYKRLKEVMFIDSIPKNATGKIMRRTLKEQY